MNDLSTGYVYVLTNESFREDWVKIGYSSKIPNMRSKELDNTAVPLPYEVYATLKTGKYKEAEKLIHSFIRKLNPELRIRPNREFFNIKPEDAASILEDVAIVLEDAEVEYWVGGKIAVESESIGTTARGKSRTKGALFSFYTKGLKDGDTIVFKDDLNITAIIIAEREVEFEGKSWKLSPLAYELFKRRNELTSSGAYQGAAYFTFDGKKLVDLPEISAPDDAAEKDNQTDE